MAKSKDNPTRSWREMKCDGKVANRKCEKCGQTFGNDIAAEHIRNPEADGKK